MYTFCLVLKGEADGSGAAIRESKKGLLEQVEQVARTTRPSGAFATVVMDRLLEGVGGAIAADDIVDVGAGKLDRVDIVVLDFPKGVECVCRISAHDYESPSWVHGAKLHL